MLFKAGQSQRPVPLKPFVLKTRDGFLIGLAMDPQKGAPCAHCVELWMKQRNVWVEPAELSDLRVRRDLLGDLVAENSAHVLYEISHDGMVTRLDCLIFPHPQCECDRANYVAPREITKKTNFAFSPISQLKCSRFGTPEGNLWLSTASGEAPLAQTTIVTYGVAADKEISRAKAVDDWLKKAVLADMNCGMPSAEPLKAEILQTGARQIVAPIARDSQSPEIVGAGATREEATLQALYQLARVRTLRRYSTSMKNPMLIVGANNWIRTRVPFFLLQQYDLHLLFYPNATPAWVVGIAAFSRIRSDEQPIFVFGSDAVIGGALDMAFAKILEVCHPAENGEAEGETIEPKRIGNGSKLNLWWTHWIYRCPKISLKDVLHLEAYPQKVDHWRDFLRDGEDPVGIIDMNTTCLPKGVRHLVKLDIPRDAERSVRNVNGIGTWSNFQDSLG